MRFYFYFTPLVEPERTVYQHTALAIAEGCRLAGIEISGNRDFFAVAGRASEYVVPYHPDVQPEDADVVIVSEGYSYDGIDLPDAVTRKSRSYGTVFLCTQDGVRLRSLERDFSCFDLVLRSSYSRAVRYGKNFRPWAFGLSNRILTSVQPSIERRAALAVNHRPNRFPHSVRVAAERLFIPKIANNLEIDARSESMTDCPTEFTARLLWAQTGRRHNPSYYERLGSALACSAFGGYFVPKRPLDKRHLISRALQRLYGGRFLSRSVIQWDSWRLWESFASGCATFHLDADIYGLVYPVMPTNWEHYIGVDFARLDDTIDRLIREPDLYTRIAAAGRTWALEHYSPRATVERLLSYLSNELGITRSLADHSS